MGVKMFEAAEAYTPAFHPQYEGECFFEESETEQTYIPLKDLVEDMSNAGRFLEEYRKARYDFSAEDLEEDIEDLQDDLNRQPGLDPGDVSMIQARLLGKRDQAIKKLREKAKADELAKAKADEEAKQSEANEKAVAEAMKRLEANKKGNEGKTP